MGSIAKAEQAARTKARQRRVKALDQQRRERDRRIETAAAEVFLGLEARTRAEQLVSDAEARVAIALRRLLAEHIDVSHVAELCQLTVHEVRRLSRHRRNSRSAARHGDPDAIAPVPESGPIGVTDPCNHPTLPRSQGRAQAVRSQTSSTTSSQAERHAVTLEETLF